MLPGTASTRPADLLDEVGSPAEEIKPYSAKDLSFDPMQELNLPKSYEEVVSRFKKLQNGRNDESMN